MTEFDEMAGNIPAEILARNVRSLEHARRVARALLPPGESETVRDNFARALMDRADEERRRQCRTSDSQCP